MKKLLFIPLAIVLVIALIFGGCKPAAEIPTEIIIGEDTSLTGMYAGFAVGGSYGVKYAAEDINEQGGIYIEDYGKKLPVRIIVVDNESDGAKAATLAEDLILHDKIDFLTTGDSLINLTAPISKVTERYKIPYVAVTGPMEMWKAMRDEVTPPWKYSWAISFSIITQPVEEFRNKPGYTIASLLGSMLGTFADQTNKRAGVYATDDPDGRGWYAGTPLILEAAGFDVLGVEENLGLFPVGTTDVSSIVEQWKDYDCEVLWGCASGVDTGTLLRQVQTMGYKPKQVYVAKGGLFYVDVSAWGGDVPLGICIELQWHPDFDPEMFPGIGDTTPKSLVERWTRDTGEPLNQAAGVGYMTAQILIDAIERAATLDRDAVNKAIGETDLMTIGGRMVFDEENQFSWEPLCFAQWQKSDKPWVWELEIVFSQHDSIPVTGEFLFPRPYS